MNFIDLKKQYLTYKDEIDAQMQDVVDSCAFIMSPKVNEIETKLAQFTNTPHAIACASGTDALLLALMAYDIKPEDEVITTPFSFIASSEMISFLGAKPVFVDIDAVTYNINPSLIRSAITPKTKGIIAVDIFGQCADFDAINAIAKDHNLFVIEDAAQSLGATYKNKPAGSLSETACTSFFPAKPLGCFGDGGMVFTHNERLYEIIRSLRLHGQGKERYEHSRIGINARFDSLQAAVLLAKWDHFPEEIDKRQTIADYYTQRLRDIVKTPHILKDNLSVFAQYSIQAERRDALQAYLKERDIPTAIHYPKPLHAQKAFAYLGYSKSDFPIAVNLSEKIISLPMHPFLTREEQDHIIDNIQYFYQP
jgi:UDP-2-acetamido-2-deoxy-ribo-hexuluronate aminotransferase